MRIVGYYNNNMILCISKRIIVLKNRKTNVTKVHDMKVDSKGQYCYYEKGKKHDLKDVVLLDKNSIKKLQ